MEEIVEESDLGQVAEDSVMDITMFEGQMLQPSSSIPVTGPSVLSFLRHAFETSVQLTTHFLFAAQVWDVAGVWMATTAPKCVVGAGVAALCMSVMAKNVLLGNVTVDPLFDFLRLGREVLDEAGPMRRHVPRDECLATCQPFPLSSPAMND